MAQTFQARFNLLPWREARRAQRQRDFVTMLGIGALVAAGAVFGVYQLYNNMITYQEQRNAYLQGEIRKLDQITREVAKLDEEKAKLINRIRTIESLQQRRPLIVAAFDNLVRQLPAEVYLNSLRTVGNRFVMRGTAVNNFKVSEMMRSLEESSWFGEATLNVIENREINRLRASDFELTVGRTQPAAQVAAVAEGDAS